MTIIDDKDLFRLIITIIIGEYLFWSLMTVINETNSILIAHINVEDQTVESIIEISILHNSFIYT